LVRAQEEEQNGKRAAQLCGSFAFYTFGLEEPKVKLSVKKMSSGDFSEVRCFPRWLLGSDETHSFERVFSFEKNFSENLPDRSGGVYPVILVETPRGSKMQKK
jgi:hypothetical protein